MSLVLQSLGELSDHLAGTGVQVVDPGQPLESVVVARDDLWATQPSVRKVVGFIARNVASIPLHVYERVSDTDRTRVTDHDLARIAKVPAPRTAAARFWERVFIDWLLHDRWCVMREPTHDGDENLVRLPPRTWRLKADALDRAVAVQTRREGRWVDHALDQFVFDHGYARVGANGTSPAITLEDLLAETSEAIAYRRSIWRNGARVPAVLERPNDAPPWSPEARSRFRRSWSNFVRGGGSEGGTPILEDGMTLSKVEAFNPKDTGDLEGRKLTDIEVATAYYIAPELLGIREGTYSNVESHRQALYRDALGPYIDQWVGALNAQLTADLAVGRDLYLEAHIDAKLRGSFEEQAAVMSTATGAPWLTRNEARTLQNRPRIEGGDELVTPLNVLVGGLASPRGTAGDGGAGGGTPPSQDEQVVSGLSADDVAKLVTAAGALIRSGFDPQASLEAVGLNPIEHTGLLPVTVQRDEKSSPSINFKGMEAGLATVDRERSALEADLSRYQARLADAVLSGLGAKTAAPIEEAFDLDAHNLELQVLLAGRSRRIAQAGAAEVLAEWNPEHDGWDPDVMDAWLLKASEVNASRMNQGIYDQLAGVVLGPEWEADSTAVLRALGWAALWALTIGTESAGFGRHDAAQASGLTTKTWQTTSGNPRPEHAALNGVTIPIDAIFLVGGRWPGDPFMPPEQNANCQCVLVYGRGETP